MSWLGFMGNIAGNLLGKLGSSAIDRSNAEKLIQAQLQAQKDLFQFENENKHQFEVSDLRAAGLNPILSATNGSAVGVGGISAPNWSSDDDLFSPAAARQLQEKQIDIAEQQAKAAETSAEAAWLNANNGIRTSTAKAYLDNTNAQIAWMKADGEMQTLFKGLQEKDANIKYLSGKYTEAIAAAKNHDANAKKALEDAVGKNLNNREYQSFLKLLEDLEKDPGMQGTSTLSAMQVARNLPYMDREGRYALIASLTDWRMSKVRDHKKDAANPNANSGRDNYDPYDYMYEYGGVRE